MLRKLSVKDYDNELIKVLRKRAQLLLYTWDNLRARNRTQECLRRISAVLTHAIRKQFVLETKLNVK